MLALKSIKIDRSEKARHDKLVSQVNEIFTRMQRISQDSIQKERMVPVASRPKQSQSFRASAESPTYRDQEGYPSSNCCLMCCRTATTTKVITTNESTTIRYRQSNS